MLKAIFFDFDGVLADTEPLHFEMFKQVLKDEGVTLSRHDYYEKYVGLDDRGCFEAVLSEHGRPAAPAVIGRMVERKSSLLLRQLQAARVVYPGIVEFVIAASRSYRLAIVSGALRHEIECILDAKSVRTDYRRARRSPREAQSRRLPAWAAAAQSAYGDCRLRLSRHRGHRRGHSGSPRRGHALPRDRQHISRRAAVCG